MNEPGMSAQELRAGRKLLMKNVAAWVAVAAFFGGCLVGVIMGGSADDRSSLAAFLFSVPLFVIQISVLTLIALVINWVVGRIRSASWYDTHGAAVEMGKIQRRVGTPDERDGDADAMGRQFMANTILIAAIILAFFLTQVR